MTDNDDVKRAVPSEPVPAGFPWALVIQILMAVLTYLIQHAVLPHDTQRLRQLKARLMPYQPVFPQGEEENS